MKLSSIILAHQASDSLKQAINSVKFSDEIIVVWDANSKNPIPKFFSQIKLIKHPLNDNFATQRNFALKKAKGSWVLFLDSDEQITPKLANQIQQIIHQDNKTNGYFIPRRDIFYNQTLKYGEAGNNKLLRLARRSAGKFIRPVHENWRIKGEAEELTGFIFHYRQDLASLFINKMIKYSPLDAKELKKENKPFAVWRAILFPLAKFTQNYFIKLGFLDGFLGLFHAYLMSIQSLTVRVFQWETTA